MTILLALAVVLNSVGEVSLQCAQEKEWRFELTSATIDENVETVTVRMSRETASAPPEFSLLWFVPQTDVHHVWTSDSTHYGIPWSEPMPSELTSGMPIQVLLDANDHNRYTFACSESVRKVVFRSPISETKMWAGEGLALTIQLSDTVAAVW